MTEATQKLLSSLLVIAGTALGAGSYHLARTWKRADPPAAAVAAPVEPSPDALAWFDAAITRCDSTCGPAPFEVEVSRESIRCLCGRPEPIPKVRVPSIHTESKP